LCDGRGALSEGKEDEQETCEDCHGTGKISKRVGVDLGHFWVDSRYLRKLRDEFTGLKFFTANREAPSPVPFRFDGGFGILMPMRRER
jgi:hypothetical protein